MRSNGDEVITCRDHYTKLTTVLQYKHDCDATAPNMS